MTPAVFVMIPGSHKSARACIDHADASIDRECVSLLPHSIQLSRHVSVGVGDGSRPVSLGPPHPGHPGLQPPV